MIDLTRANARRVKVKGFAQEPMSKIYYHTRSPPPESSEWKTQMTDSGTVTMTQKALGAVRAHSMTKLPALGHPGTLPGKEKPPWGGKEEE